MIRVPSQKTLNKYGLTEQDFLDIWKRQGEICPICHKEPSTGNVVIDHYHQKYYAKLPTTLRKAFVRGVTCWFCNRNYLAKGITIQKSENVTRYLQDFENRRPK